MKRNLKSILKKNKTRIYQICFTIFTIIMTTVMPVVNYINARALTDLENVCWVCNAPIDISKPTKPYKEEKLKEKDIIKETPKKPKNHKS